MLLLQDFQEDFEESETKYFERIGKEILKSMRSLLQGRDLFIKQALGVWIGQGILEVLSATEAWPDGSPGAEKIIKRNDYVIPSKRKHYATLIVTFLLTHVASTIPGNDSNGSSLPNLWKLSTTGNKVSESMITIVEGETMQEVNVR